ncbi:MAG: O-antigen ligase family protein [Anaerolineae bacterium]|nr:O-antigen ligase family protein [Anaerolineae bacterium]
MKRRSNLFARSILSILWTYAVLGGATASGILTPQYTFMTLTFLTLIMAGWLLIRWRQGWVWHRTPLDGAFILWGAAVVISTAANMDLWQRIAIGLWFGLAYLGLWYLAQDVIANHALDRQLLAESLLIAGAVAMLFGYIQMAALVGSGALRNLAVLENLRPAGTLDNPNFMAAFLVLLLPIAIGCLLTTRSRAGRLVLALYIVLVVVLLAFTFSRAGWLGCAVALLVMGVLVLAHYRLLSPARLREWWQTRSGSIKVALGGLAVIILLIGVLGLLVTIRSLNSSSRAADLRTYIYDTAIQLFKEKPLTGYGLFTFGRGLLRLASTPPYTPHNSAHNIILNVAAELGLPGLLALAVTAILALRAARQNWQSGQHRILLAASIGGVVGLTVDHMLDTPTSSSPLVVVAFILTLTLATAPVNPVPVPIWQRRLRPALLTGMWIILLLTGFWTTNVYKDYVAALQYSSQSQDYAGTAQRLKPVIDAAPAMPVYHLYNGYFLGLAAHNGDQSALPQAIAAYRRFCDLEPYYAPAWANLAALYWQANQRDLAVQAIEQAVHIAPKAWNLQFNLGMYYEAVGKADRAGQAYREALTVYPDASILPAWQQSDLRRQIARENDKVSVLARTVQLLSAGKADEAAQVWQGATSGAPAVDRVMAELLALAKGDRKAAADYLAAIKPAATDLQGSAWLHLGLARLASSDGDDTTARQERDTAHKFLAASPAALDDRIPAITYTQFWKTGLSQYYLPQVYAPPADAPLLVLLGSDNP